MGSNIHNGGANSCNGIHAPSQEGISTNANFSVKNQQQHSFIHSTVLCEEDKTSPHSTSTNTSLSSSPSAVAKQKDVAQVMVAPVNGYAKNFSSMDHNHSAGSHNINPHEDEAQIHHQNPHFHPHLQQQIFQQYRSSSNPHQQPLAVSGGAMGRLAGDVGYHLDNQHFRAPAVEGAGTLVMPSHFTHSLSTSSTESPGQNVSPVTAFSEGDKSTGKRRPRKRPKTCGVCGDRAKSFHFGGLSCDSCKAFFRRSVQHDAHMGFRCAYDNSCDIQISTRKSCQFCRFAKCLSIGMEKSWVMSEEERNALNQQRMEKKQGKVATSTCTSAQPQGPQQEQIPAFVASLEASSSLSSTSTATAPPEPTYTFKGTSVPVSATSTEPVALAFQGSEYVADVDKMLDYMAYDEQLEIKFIVETYLHAYKEMPFRVSHEQGRRDTLEIIEMFTTILRRFAYFAKLIPDFAALAKGDQGNLLRATVLEMCLLRGAVCFDTDNNRWPNNLESLKDCPSLRVEDMQRLVSRELFEMHITFIFHMKRLRIDEPIAMLLIMTVLFSPERISHDDKTQVSQGQEKYLMLLKKYTTWKFGDNAGSRIYPQLLTKLSDLRQLNDFHTEFHLNLDRQEVNAIRKSLMEINLNPYPNWKIVPESQKSSPEESPTASPVIPTPSSLELAPPSPMITPALIQSFADKRIPALLENPFAVFENDLGMIRQVQQTLGSLFPTSSASFTGSNTQPVPLPINRQPSTDSESTKVFSQHDSVLGSDKGASRSTSMSPRGYASSSDSTDAQALELLQSSRPLDYHPPSLQESMTIASPHLESPIANLVSGEYHSERLQQFLQQSRGGSEFELQGVIRGVNASATSTSQTTQPSLSSTFTLSSGSQQQHTPTTVLRKHSSSSRSSLPVASSSVIRSGPSARMDSMNMLPSSMPTEVTSLGGKEGSSDIHPFCSIRTSSSGWHGGEIHTTTNGHRQSAPASSTITVTSRISSTPFSNPDGNEEVSSKRSQ